MKTLSPMRANSIEQVCRLNTDNHSRPDFWILTDGYNVTICQQRNGESSTASVTVPRAEFNRLIRWYIREQKIRSRAP